MTNFARPAVELGQPTVAPLTLTVKPASNKGFTVNDTGEVPTAVTDGQWTWEFVQVSVNFPDLAAHSGTTETVTIPDLQVGDLCFYIGQDQSDQNSRINTVRDPVCSTEEQITLQTFNANTAANNPGASLLSFLVAHRFITQ